MNAHMLNEAHSAHERVVKAAHPCISCPENRAAGGGKRVAAHIKNRTEG